MIDRRQAIKLFVLSATLSPLESMAKPLQISASTYKKIKNLHIGPLLSSPLHSKDFDDLHIKDYLTKIRNPNRPHKDDLVLTRQEKRVLENVVNRFLRIRRTVGHGHFCIISLDDAMRIARDYPKVGSFSTVELTFLENIFYTDAEVYGFKGSRQLKGFTDAISPQEVYKVPYTGNYLFKGKSLEKYQELTQKVGEELVLTSGIRGMAKQFYLFLAKANRYDGNLSLASRSLAPPGYSYHATGDFDVGQRGFGTHNFSVRFTTTDVFHTLASNGYVEHRYQRDNMLGVRYEPWHIKL